jgi:hypothetical protein
MPEKKEASDMVVIRNYFFPGAPAGVVLAEVKKLTDQDKKQLADGIRNGSLTY